SGVCISKKFVCNLYEDCLHGEDELNCNCSDTDFECRGGKCVSLMLTCDGVNDCPDGDDERDEFC
ncbi:hypothetical protein HELRODRAFT_147182, partial [Helobdella robusta]|uniref:EB domain-containing protein n=1 Tax=Helobdella robusta TaxID=6412 RepID=T1EJX7_HELRO